MANNENYIPHFSPYPVAQSVIIEAQILVSENGLRLKDLRPELQNNKEVVKSAIKQNILAFQYASASLQNDIEILKLVEEYYHQDKNMVK